MINRIYFELTAAPGLTGDFAVGPPVYGPFQTLGAEHDGARLDVSVQDGLGWEIRRDCVYTHATATLTRGVFEEGSTGSALTLSASSRVMVAIVGTRADNLRTIVAGRDYRPSVADSISLPAHMDAAWWKLNEGTGATVIDQVSGLSCDIVNTTTNLWDNPGWATLNVDTNIRIRNNSTVDELMRLDTLSGSLIVGLDISPAVPAAANAHLWGYGDNGNNTVGGYSGFVNTTAAGATQMAFCPVGGSTFGSMPQNLTSLLKVKNRKLYHWVIHRIGGRLWVDGYENGWHSRSCQSLLLEAGPPTVATAQGLRIGSRPNGVGGGAANYAGGATAITLPKIRNFHVLRITGDYRPKIPGWLNNIAATMPYGLIPEVFNV